ncbi:MAG TPA: SDR family NAD(P)-dependent oxidoreductase [Chitinophagaceae bacterium]|nr:SDR family NAD(P)-dependent oxidoreductase [Chitinophagaceae bacterium]
MTPSGQIPTIVIIGATSGIGRKMAELYAQKGYKVGITGRRKELLEEIRTAYTDLIETECFDVTGKDNIVALESLVCKLGSLDTLVYSSGIGEPSKNLDWQLDKMMVDTNVNGFVEIANWTFNYFVKQGHGRMAVISSIAANRGNSWAPAYSASKSFQSNYFEALAIKAYRMKKDIGITCIEPGFVDTKMAKGNKRFWVASIDKAARQIISAIDKKKRKVYISRRWWLIAMLMKWMPFFIYKRFG